AGWYGKQKPAAVAKEPGSPEASVTPTSEVAAQPQPSPSGNDTRGAEAADVAAKRQREKDRAKAAREERSAAVGAARASSAYSEAANRGAKKVATVTVTYDESGHVTSASGDAAAARIARQRRFPPGKAGSATITIPINQ